MDVGTFISASENRAARISGDKKSPLGAGLGEILFPVFGITITEQNQSLIWRREQFWQVPQGFHISFFEILSFVTPGKQVPARRLHSSRGRNLALPPWQEPR